MVGNVRPSANLQQGSARDCQGRMARASSGCFFCCTAFGQVALLSFPRFLDGQRWLPNTSSGQGRMGVLMYGCTAFERYDKHHELKYIKIP